MRQITRKREQYQDKGTWETTAEEDLLWAMGMKLVAKYIDIRRDMVDQWVALQPLPKVFYRETVYMGGGCKKIHGGGSE